MAYGCLSQALRPIIRLAVADFFASCLPLKRLVAMIFPALLFSFPFLPNLFFLSLINRDQVPINCTTTAAMLLFFSYRVIVYCRQTMV